MVDLGSNEEGSNAFFSRYKIRLSSSGLVSLRETSDVRRGEGVAAKDEEPVPMEEMLSHPAAVRVGETAAVSVSVKISAICDTFLCLFAYKSEPSSPLSHIFEVLLHLFRTYIFASL